VHSQRNPAIWLNVKKEPADEGIHTTVFVTDFQQSIQPEEDNQIQVKEELNFEEITIKEEFIPDE